MQVIIWGLVSLLTSQVKTAGQIIATRFILGFVEAPFFPGILFYLSKWVRIYPDQLCSFDYFFM